MTKPNLLAIDLAKNVFQVCELSPNGKVMFNREVSRTKLKALLMKENQCLVAMEACSSAHYWARYAIEIGHQVKVINARAVKAFQTKQKTDRNDALAIGIAAQQVHIHGTRIHSTEEQALQSLERTRHLAKTQLVAHGNQMRGLLAEFGIVLPQGLTKLRKEVPFILEEADNLLPASFRAALYRSWAHLLCQFEYLDELEKQLESLVKSNSACQKLMKLEGVGPLGALGLALRLGKGEDFANGREASANIGLTPKQHSSGGKEHIGHISKYSADKRLRSVLFQGALSVITHVLNRPATTYKEQLLQALVVRRGKKVAAIALANKTVRTAYALLKNDSVYQPIKLA